MGKAGTVRIPSLYDVHPGVATVQKWIAELKEKTGHSLGEWVVTIQNAGPKGEKERRDWLKQKHKLGTNSAWWLAARAQGKDTEEDTPEKYLAIAPKYVEEQYAGKKAALRPAYEKLLKMAKSLGRDVKACPCRTIVPLYREHVFAQLKPATSTRIDLGLALAKHEGRLPKRIIDTGGLAKKDRITHRIEISSDGDIDEDVKKWLKIAYDLDA
ncbi:MAG TPA: DUF5655 domain-containing protein [Terriglobales bacterium]|nr:DUF5655 domain-containing protein [Terriglobales bacterium]